MLRNRYNRTDLFALVPRLGLRFEPQLEQLDRLFGDDELFAFALERLVPPLDPPRYYSFNTLIFRYY